ncbi:MAG: homoserine kinase [Gemmatimonadota bacterium]
MRQTATAFAPGSVGNVGPGLDILGLAVAGCGDAATLVRSGNPGIVIAESGHPELTSDPLRHATAIAIKEVFTLAGYRGGAIVHVTKGLPLSGGQGGSAASAIAGAVAANHLLDAGLDTNALLRCALTAESTVAGRHADNLAPSLLGGLVLVRSLDPIDVIRLPVPASLRVVLVHPEQQLRTRDARAVLPETIGRQLALAQAANIAAMVAAACLDDVALFGRALDDRIAEPARATLLPGFLAAKRAALDAGALGCSISGAGPTAFAITGDEPAGARVATAMVAAYEAAGMAATARVAEVDRNGATAT